MSDETKEASLPEYQGVIHPNDELGKCFGFTGDRYSGYISKKGNSIYVTGCDAKNASALWMLVNSILEHGYAAKAVGPKGDMRSIFQEGGLKTVETQSGVPFETMVLLPSIVIERLISGIQ